MALKIAAFAFVALCLTFFVFGEPEDASKACLGCICDAATECNTTIGCVGDICGPFRLTSGYWTDGGKPKLNDSASGDDDFKECANDAFCAGRALQGYMKKYAKDCNGDGKVNCDDYARIHFLGPEGCTGEMPAKNAADYKYCRDVFPQ